MYKSATYCRRKKFKIRGKVLHSSHRHLPSAAQSPATYPAGRIPARSRALRRVRDAATEEGVSRTRQSVEKRNGLRNQTLSRARHLNDVRDKHQIIVLQIRPRRRK